MYKTNLFCDVTRAEFRQPDFLSQTFRLSQPVINLFLSMLSFTSALAHLTATLLAVTFYTIYTFDCTFTYYPTISSICGNTTSIEYVFLNVLSFTAAFNFMNTITKRDKEGLFYRPLVFCTGVSLIMLGVFPSSKLLNWSTTIHQGAALCFMGLGAANITLPWISLYVLEKRLENAKTPTNQEIIRQKIARIHEDRFLLRINRNSPKHNTICSEPKSILLRNLFLELLIIIFLRIQFYNIKAIFTFNKIISSFIIILTIQRYIETSSNSLGYRPRLSTCHLRRTVKAVAAINVHLLLLLRTTMHQT